jgi:hypothetical protein
MEILCLEMKAKHVREQSVECISQIAHGAWLQIGRGWSAARLWLLECSFASSRKKALSA